MLPDPSEIQQLRDRLAEAKTFRRQAQFALETYAMALSRSLGALRGLRSWRVMLALNKTYVLLFQRGWRGRLEWSRWAAAIPLRGFGELDLFEPQLPDITPLLPFAAPVLPEDRAAAASQFPAPIRYDVMLLAADAHSRQHSSIEGLAGTFGEAGHRVFLVRPSIAEPATPAPVSRAQRVWQIYIPPFRTGEPAETEVIERLNTVILNSGIHPGTYLLEETEWDGVAASLATTWGTRSILALAGKESFDSLDGQIRAAHDLVSIIVVTYNSGLHISACLDSILRHATYPSLEIICIDNASGDSTVSRLQEYASRDPRIHLELLDRNVGFAAANNVGVRRSSGRYITLLNADTVVTSGWMERCLKHLRNDPSLGMLNPVTNFAGNEAMIACDYSTPAELDLFAATLARERNGCTVTLQCCPFFCVMLSRSVWEQAGEMDEQFGLGMFEDDDYAVRVSSLGLRLAAAEDCFVHHFGQAAFGAMPSAKYGALFLENRRRFERKWNRAWTPHRKRPGVQGMNRRIAPEAFLAEVTVKAR